MPGEEDFMKTYVPKPSEKPRSDFENIRIKILGPRKLRKFQSSETEGKSSLHDFLLRVEVEYLGKYEFPPQEYADYISNLAETDPEKVPKKFKDGNEYYLIGSLGDYLNITEKVASISWTGDGFSVAHHSLTIEEEPDLSRDDSRFRIVRFKR